MVTTSIQVYKTKNKPEPKPAKTNNSQSSLFGANLPLNVQLKALAVDQIERDFWALLEARTDRRKARTHRQSAENFNRDFNKAVMLGFSPADIISAVIESLIEDDALSQIYKNMLKKGAR